MTDGTTNVVAGNYLQQFGSVEVTINPSTAVTGGAMWEVDGSGTWQTTGTVVSNLSAVSNHIVSFSVVAGFATPPTQMVSVTNGTTNMVTGNYLPPSGSLEVTILPPTVVTAGAVWQVDGGPWEASDAVVSGLNSSSNHTLVFTNIPGWITPSNLTVSVANGLTTTVTDTYVLSAKYTITVSASPAAGGTASGGGMFASGSSQTVTASAKSGYSFANWTENGVAVSSATNYTFTLTNNQTLVANFIKWNPQLTITSPKSGQSVSNEPFVIKGTVKDSEAVAGVFYKLNTNAWTPATPGNSWKQLDRDGDQPRPRGQHPQRLRGGQQRQNQHRQGVQLQVRPQRHPGPDHQRFRQGHAQ